MAHEHSENGVYGLLAEFDSVDALLAAADKVQAAGYTRTDAFSPIPIHGLAEKIGFKDRRMSKIVLCGGLAGLIGGYGLEYWTQVIAYPLNIGGRPFHAWVNFIPPAFETTILFASFAAVIGMLTLNGLPRPYHPVFNAPRFKLASQSAFFLVIEASDPKFHAQATWDFLSSLHPHEVVQVEK